MPAALLQLAVVVPTFNERANVIELIARLHALLRDIDHEIIVVDDDSPDGTAEAVREVAREDRRVRVLQRVGRRGLSSACIEGMMTTAAPAIAVIDADLQHDETLLPQMLERLTSESLDLVIGTRNAGGGSMGSFAESRVRLSEAGRTLSRLVTHSELSDPMSGFFMLDRRFLEEVIGSLSGVGFKILLDLIASSARPVRFVEIPYHFRERLHGESKLDVVVGLEYLLLLIDKKIGDLIPPRFVVFGAVGGAGVVLHLAILWALLRLGGQRFLVAQAVAAFVVMTVNFFVNNALTWRDRRLRGRAVMLGLLQFYAACAIGAFVNVRVAAYAIQHGTPWYLAGLAGLLVGSVWNFAVTAATTWRVRRRRRARPAAAA
ncbi:MAG TPA: glycosyltransferase family 2 protein [Thermoanaerobaculia bacterium]|nr:glycosyltransferase family 2 protein [Thermoanaerobaculia bacterium]